MRNQKLFYWIFLMLFVACQPSEDYLNKPVNKHKNVENGESKFPASIDFDNAKKGKLFVKLSQESGSSIVFSTKENTVETNEKEMNKFFAKHGVKKMRPVFTIPEKFAKRSHKAGLHLWYVVDFDENVPVSDAVINASKLKSIAKIEPAYDFVKPKMKAVEIKPSASLYATTNFPFNDPELKRQWHYENTKPLANSNPEADISLFDAWKKETGKPNVIVAVIDEGVDYNHEDLKENMHINQAEKNGQPNVDDDGNGYIDDIYGFNFADKKVNEIEPADHGTHVAGTVAARNNNGIGVCGVAGGDGTPNSGVRILACQIFKGNNANVEAEADALTYAANNGAVIAQCSWGFPKTARVTKVPLILKDAIDYFIKYAGCDKDGNQLPSSPMKGGLVCFASGNEGFEWESVPAYYEPVIAVGSFDHNFKKTWYTVYGTWLDILAPGGLKEAGWDYQVYSTLKDNRYGFFEGTSMACPHVSGVAGLIVSKFGGQGFTNNDLKKRLLNAVKDISVDKNNPKYIGKVGLGYLDANKALEVLDTSKPNKKPIKPEITEVIPSFITIDVNWKASSDENDGTPRIYKVYYSKTPIDNSNYQSAEFVTISGIGYDAGENVKCVLEKLELDTKYYIAIQAIDRWDLASDLNFTEAKTKLNHNPTITRKDNKVIRVTGQEKQKVVLIANDIDGNTLRHELAGYQVGVTARTQGRNELVLTFKALGDFGKHTVKVIVFDEYDGKVEMDIPFEYYNSDPYVVKKFNMEYVVVDKEKQINLLDYFADPEQRKMLFSAHSDDKTVKVSVDKSKLIVKGLKEGFATINISAFDSDDAKIDGTLRLKVANKGIVNLIYPIPVKDKLNVIVGENVSALKFKILTSTGKVVYRKNMIISKNQRKVVLDVSQIATGNYIFRAEDKKNNKYEQSFVKY